MIVTWMSNPKEVHSKPKLHVSMSTYYLEYGRHVARLRRCRRAYAPTSNTASHDNHEKINSWVSLNFVYGYGAPLIGLRVVQFRGNRALKDVRTNCFRASLLRTTARANSHARSSIELARQVVNEQG